MLIQVAAGSCDRNIYNERTLEYLETRHSSRPYPYPYGFIIDTSAADGGCVDCYLITSDKVTSGTIVECEPVEFLLQDEAGEMDHKVLAVLPGQDVPVGPELL
jgi:inorganic pyrophosphatase